METIIYSLIAVILVLTIYGFYLDINEKLFYESSLKREKMISRLAEIRMRLIQMVHMKELNPNSKYFIFMFASCSHLIRIIYKHKVDRETLEKYNLLKKFYEELKCEEKQFCDDVRNEIKTLNHEQKTLLCTVSSFIISSYTINYLDKIFYTVAKYFILKFKEKFISIIQKDKIQERIPEEIKIKYETAKTFDNDINAVFCPAYC